MINGLTVSNGRIQVYRSGHALSRRQSRDAFYQLCGRYQGNAQAYDTALTSLLYEMHPREN